jgi:hypothetical protein
VGPRLGSLLLSLAPIFGSIFVWTWTAFEGKTRNTFQALRENPRAIRLLALGALIRPVLGVSSSLLAIQHAEIGVASTFMAWTKSHTFFGRLFPQNLAFTT